MMTESQRYAAMDDMMDSAPLIPQRTAQQEYDAVSSMALRRIDDKQERLQAEHQARKAEFCRMVVKDRLSTADELTVNRILEDNCTGDVLRMLVRSCLLGHSTHALAIASRLRQDCAEYYSDTRED